METTSIAPAAHVPSATHNTPSLHASLVHGIAHRVARTLPRHILVDDLVAYGFVGLLESIERAPEDMPANEFRKYAGFRIRGAMLDHLRSSDRTTRCSRAKGKEIERAKAKLAKEGRGETDVEVASELGWSTAEYQEAVLVLERASHVQMVSADKLANELVSPLGAPDESLDRAETLRLLADAIEALPARYQQLLNLHYVEDYMLREIGELFGVTTSRVSQMHTEAMRRLRNALVGEDISYH